MWLVLFLRVSAVHRDGGMGIAPFSLFYLQCEAGGKVLGVNTESGTTTCCVVRGLIRI